MARSRHSLVRRAKQASFAVAIGVTLLPGTGKAQTSEQSAGSALSVPQSQQEQTRRFLARISDGRKIWKLSPMDLESHRRWYDYSRARDDMLLATDTPFAPWYIVNADDKKRARLNCISHLLSLIPYEETTREGVKLPKRQKPHGYAEPKNRRYNIVPDVC